jgi:hypothetical protein
MHGTYNIKITTIILSHQNKVVHLPDEFKLTVKLYIKAGLYMLHCDMLRTTLFWFNTQQVVVTSYQNFGTIFRGQESKRKPFVPIQSLHREESLGEIS